MVSLSNHAHPPGFRIESGITTGDAGHRVERRHLRARLDALYLHLYGLDRDDAGYVLDTFPIVRREDEAHFDSRYRIKELILAYMNAMAAGDTETVVAVERKTTQTVPTGPTPCVRPDFRTPPRYITSRIPLGPYRSEASTKGQSSLSTNPLQTTPFREYQSFAQDKAPHYVPS